MEQNNSLLSHGDELPKSFDLGELNEPIPITLI